MSGHVVIVGAGQAGLQVAISLRQNGFAGAVTIVGEEERPPYQRPPLSKAYLQDDQDFERLTLRPAAFYADAAVDLRLSERVVRIDRDAGSVALRSGGVLGFDWLVLATGARNRVLPIAGATAAGVHMLRSAADAEALRSALGTAQRMVVVGGGFIGLEVAASARARGIAVTVLEASERLMGRVVSPAISAFFLGAHQAMGTEVHLGAAVLEITSSVHATGVVTADAEYPADLVLLAAGVVPNVELAEEAGLEIAGGIRVDRFMTTADPRIFAIGDCAVFDSRPAQGLVRLESVQNAVDQAKCVASRILGGDAAYDCVPWFWSDQGLYKLQVAGLASRADHVHVSDSADDGRIVAYAFAGEDLVGIETVNRPGEHMAGRKLLSADFRLARSEVERHGFDLKVHVAALSKGALPSQSG